MTARIDRLVTSGTFSLDGGTWDVDNNVWIVGDEAECVVIDPAHDAAAIAAAVAGRNLKAILLTHGHDDHIAAVGALRDLVPRTRPSSSRGPDAVAGRLPGHRAGAQHQPRRSLHRGRTGAEGAAHAGTLTGVRILPPGGRPGRRSTVFTGDTLFQGGPGATGRSYSDFPTIIDSIRRELLTLPAGTVVRTGHGDTTTIGAEAPNLDEWIARGH